MLRIPPITSRWTTSAIVPTAPTALTCATAPPWHILLKPTDTSPQDRKSTADANCWIVPSKYKLDGSI